MTESNTQIILKSYPIGWVNQDNFEVRKSTIPEPGENGVIVRNIYMSVDPYMRVLMTGRASYAESFQIGEPLRAGVVGQVSKSTNAKFSKGDFVTGKLGWEQFSLAVDGVGLSVINPDLAPLSYYLSVLGMPGMTAYVGLLDIGEPKEGETVMVSSAFGAVGQIVGQIAKAKGCYVVGSTGRDDKVAYVMDELGFDAAFNYKTVHSLGEALDQYCPQGIDVCFENVGGAMLDAVLTRINVGARIVVCGMISQLNLEKPEGIYNLVALIVKRAKMEGFITDDHYDQLPQFRTDMSGWLREGTIKYREDVVEGVENAPSALIRMLKGENFGKQIVQISEDPTGT